MVITADNKKVKGFNKNELMGYIILTVGIGLQMLVFFLALYLIFNPETLQGFLKLVEDRVVVGGKLPGAMSIFISVGLLFVMGILSSMIGKYGLELSRHRSPDGVGDE
ncbi:MAG: hypothetical protein ACOCTN_05305 [Candidatus Natronoplasma sp.]